MKFKKGDTVVVIGNSTDHKFNIGDIVVVSELCENLEMYFCKAYGENENALYNCVKEEDIQAISRTDSEARNSLKMAYDKKVQELESKLNSAEHFGDNMYGNIRFLEGQVAALEGMIKMILLNDNG